MSSVEELQSQIAELQRQLDLLLPKEEEVEEHEEENTNHDESTTNETKKSGKRKNKKKKKATAATKKNAFEGIPYEQQLNPLPEHPHLYETHPRAENFTQRELNKLLPDGVPVNLKDTPFIVCGFLTSREIIKKIEMYYFEQFVRRFPFMKAAKFMYDGMCFMGQRCGVPQMETERYFDEIFDIEMRNMLEFGAEHEFGMFVDAYKTELDANFKKLFGFQPTAEGFKLFGAFKTEDDADDFIENSKTYHISRYLKLFKGDAREILCYDPTDRQVEDKRYISREVAQLMQQLNKNGNKRVDAFTARMKRRLIEQYNQNQKLAEQTNQKLTMHVDKDGNITESAKQKVLEALPSREVKPSAPVSAELKAAGAQGGMVNVSQCIERTDVTTGETITEIYEGKDATYSKF